MIEVLSRFECNNLFYMSIGKDTEKSCFLGYPPRPSLIPIAIGTGRELTYTNLTDCNSVG